MVLLVGGDNFPRALGILGVRQRDWPWAEVLVAGGPGDRQDARFWSSANVQGQQLNLRLGEVHLDPDLGRIACAGRRVAEADAAASDHGQAEQALIRQL